MNTQTRQAGRLDGTLGGVRAYEAFYRLVFERIDAERSHYIGLNALRLLLGPRRVRFMLHLLGVNRCLSCGVVWGDPCPRCLSPVKGPAI